MKTIKLLFMLALFSLASVMSGCSDQPVITGTGTGGSVGGGTGTSSVPTSLSVSIFLRDGPSATDNDISSISPGNPGYLTIQVIDQDGNAAPDQIVTVDTSLAKIDPTSFLTDSSGRATAMLEYNNAVGADSLIATSSLSGEEFSATKNYAVTSTGTSVTSSLSISMTLKDGPASSDADVTVISADSPGYLTLTLLDENSNPVANQIVSVSTTLAKVVPTTALTDATGKAQITLDYLNNLGADQILVSTLYDGTNYSDSLNYAVVAPSIQMGDASGGSSAFVSGQLAINISSFATDGTSLSSSGSASVSAYLVDANNQPFTTPLEVSFSSVCASLTDPLSTIDQKVTTSAGIATATYEANGCEGEDTITATVSFGGSTYSATGKITVASGAVGSINFVSASPAQITLKGGATVAGLQETSELIFQVVDTSGLPLKNQSVSFSLSGSAGDVILTQLTGVTNVNGEVSTVVQAGSIPLVVNVIATVDATGISTQSTGLVISAGLPDYDSFTIGADILNPEAADYIGTEVNLTVNLADIYNNPPPVGTPVFFTAEGGSIGGTCSTDANGRCSVLWLSGNPRPADDRVTILAYTQGVESFVDKNGNGKFSNGDTIQKDLGEVFRDDNESNNYDSGEFYVDFNQSGSIDTAPDGQYNGNLCDATPNIAGGCSSQKSLNISRQLVLTQSSSHPKISVTSGGVLLADESQDYINDLDISGGQTKTMTVTYSDINGQPLPVKIQGTIVVGTSISVSTSGGIGTAQGTTSVTQANTNIAGSNSFVFTLEDSNAANPGSGQVAITVITPKQVTKVIHFNVTE